TAVEFGLDDLQIATIAAAHKPTIDKAEGKGSPDEWRATIVANLIAKKRPLHDHLGQDCAEADCPNKSENWERKASERWLTTECGHGPNSNGTAGFAPAPGGPAVLSADPPSGGPAPAARVLERDVNAGVDGLRYTDAGNGRRLITAHGDRVRYVPPWG